MPGSMGPIELSKKRNQFNHSFRYGNPTGAVLPDRRRGGRRGASGRGPRRHPRNTVQVDPRPGRGARHHPVLPRRTAARAHRRRHGLLPGVAAARRRARPGAPGPRSPGLHRRCADDRLVRGVHHPLPGRAHRAPRRPRAAGPRRCGPGDRGARPPTRCRRRHYLRTPAATRPRPPPGRTDRVRDLRPRRRLVEHAAGGPPLRDPHEHRHPRAAGHSRDRLLAVPTHPATGAVPPDLSRVRARADAAGPMRHVHPHLRRRPAQPHGTARPSPRASTEPARAPSHPAVGARGAPRGRPRRPLVSPNSSAPFD